MAMVLKRNITKVDRMIGVEVGYTCSEGLIKRKGRKTKEIIP